MCLELLRWGAFSRELEQFKHPKVGCNWLSGYTVFVVVVVQPQPWRVSDSIKYLNIVHKAYRSFLGLEWLRYDKMFHMGATMDPTLHWDRKETELWTKIMLHRIGLLAGSVHTVATCCL